MKHSLHIGLNVVQPAAYAGWGGELNGCVGDCQSLAALLASAGFTTRALINDDATIAAVSTAFIELATRAEAGDLVVIHNSCHGGRVNYGLLGGYHETWCLSDDELIDLQLRDLLSQFRPGVNVVLLMDSCHSGGMDRGAMRSKARPGFIRADLQPLPRADRTVNASVVALPACRAEETCTEQNVPEYTEVRGAWSWSLAQALDKAQQRRAPLTVCELFGAARRYAAQHFPHQHAEAKFLGPNHDGVWSARLA